ncbi:MAG: YjjG family noncanonical pyrimidine nucleotidase, partial [Duncaniella sp.]|nr:YjjG family noncanonical pyrimidine nucleotidase [Duncaniella sp.]
MNSETARRLTEGVTWVWLDLDDTLVDFGGTASAALRDLYDTEVIGSLYPSAEEWEEAYVSWNHHLWDLYAKGEITQDYLRLDRFAHPLRAVWRGTEEELTAYARALDPLYLGRLAENTRLLPGAMELMEAVRAAGMRTGILSNGFRSVQYEKLRRTGLDKVVDLVVLSDDIGVNKPDVRLYRHAMEQSGEPRAEAHLMVGDNPSTDIAGALNAGWRAILVDPSAEGSGVTITPD